ncbi:MAG: ATP-grasp domain-containing protein [Micavibrio sp.]
MRILISAANADVCLSMARILRTDNFYSRAKIIGLVPDAPWPALHFFDDVISVPMADSPHYDSSLESIINDLKPEIFVPFSEAELSWFAANYDMISSLGTKVIINNKSVLDTFLDKRNTAQYLRGLGVPVPKTYDPESFSAEFLPVIIKPRRSAGSKNMAVIRNNMQWEGFKLQHKQDLPEFVVQELIDVPDAEFTCALWRVGATGKQCTFRRRLQGGMTGVAHVEHSDSIVQVLENIADSIQGDFFINVQLRLRDNVPYVFEINPRFSSTVMMRHKIGFSDFIWTLNSSLQREEEINWDPPIGTTIFRVSDECVVNKEGIVI